LRERDDSIFFGARKFWRTRAAPLAVRTRGTVPSSENPEEGTVPNSKHRLSPGGIIPLLAGLGAGMIMYENKEEPSWPT
jgi:hypothetical protein